LDKYRWRRELPQLLWKVEDFFAVLLHCFSTRIEQVFVPLWDLYLIRMEPQILPYRLHDPQLFAQRKMLNFSDAHPQDWRYFNGEASAEVSEARMTLMDTDKKETGSAGENPRPSVSIRGSSYRLNQRKADLCLFRIPRSSLNWIRRP